VEGAVFRAVAGGVELRVKAQPRSRRPGLGGLAPAPDGAALRVAVTEAPEDGRANRAVCLVIAAALDVPGSAVEVAQGATSRRKTLRIAGDPARLIERLERLIA
jgi:uncharacterized protein YggU (UPF0235/DUF167 family)